MPSNEYQRAIDTLRDREVYPSFDQMRHLVAAAKPRRRQMAVGVAFFLAGVAMTAAVFSVIGADHNNSRNIVAQNAVLSQRSSVTATVSTNTKTAGQLSILELEHQRSSKPIGISINNEHDDLATTVLQKNEQQADVSRGIDRPDRILTIPSAEQAVAPVRNIRSFHDVSTERVIPSSSDEKGRATLFVNGGIAPFIAAPGSASLRNAAIGYRYQFTPRSSFIVELRNVSFSSKQVHISTGYNDTTISVGGQSYNNTIGASTTSSGNGVLSAISIGTGYRLAFPFFASFVPYAELGIGAATIGAVTSQRLGLSYQFDSPFSFEAFASSDQLYASGTKPNFTFGFSAGIGYSW